MLHSKSQALANFTDLKIQNEYFEISEIQYQ